MKKYKCVQICPNAEDTENMLNKLAKDGWSVVCSYASHNLWLILEKEI